MVSSKNRQTKYSKAKTFIAKNDSRPLVLAVGSGLRGINYNLFAMSGKLHPHLAVNLVKHVFPNFPKSYT
jgi:hypothetical protein